MTKRKRKEKLAPDKTKKRVLPTPSEDAVIRAMYEPASTQRLQPFLVLTMKTNSAARNASFSFLLRMPFEIRNEIWALVLGHQLIHLKYVGSIRNPAGVGQTKRRQIWRHIVCQCDRPEDERFENSRLTKINGNEEIVRRQPHHDCDDERAYDIPANREQWGHESMDLKTLQVCRQIYNEANNVLWSTNTFSFNDAGLNLHHFMNARTTHQKQLLRRLRLQMDWVWEEADLFNRVLNPTFIDIRSLTGLRFLRLKINHSLETAHNQEAKAREDGLGLVQTHLEFVRKMAVLPLVSVEVFVGDHSQPLNVDALWTA